MNKFKNVMTTENLVDFLDQKPRIDAYTEKVYFACPYCKEEALERFKEILKEKDFEKIKNMDLEFGTLIYDPKTHEISCCSRPNSNYTDEHAMELEASMVEEYSILDYPEYLEAKFQDYLNRKNGGNNDILQ